MDGNWTHKDLEAWQRALTLAEQIYQSTKLFPSEERFGLSSQMRRAAVSVPSNIAEGAARKSRQEFLQFLHIARGSLSELDTQVILAIRLKYVSEETEVVAEIQRVGRLLTGLIAKLKRD
jgi:four helix bundle protein